MARLPTPGGDSGNWGEILNEFLSESLDSDGTLRSNSVGASQLMDNSVTADALAPGVVTANAVGLGNVNNTSDASKPISAAAQSALNDKISGPDSANNNTLVRFDGTSGKLIKSSAITIDNDGKIGVGTTTPTHAITLPTASSGFVTYNSSDQVTNYERIRMFWNNNSFNIMSEFGGTATHRPLSLASGGSNIILDNLASQGYKMYFSSGSTSVTDPIRLVSTLASTNSLQNGLALRTTINQTGTAGYTALLINATETQTGSGAKSLIDLQVGGASRFLVDNSGSTTVTGSLRAHGQYTESTTNTGVHLGYFGPSTATPRILFGNGNATQNWQIDNQNGLFRWYTPSVVQMTLDTSGILSLPRSTAAIVMGGDTSLTRLAPTVTGMPGMIKTNSYFSVAPDISALSTTLRGLSNSPTFTLASDDGNGWWSLGMTNEPTYNSTINKAAGGSFMGGIYNNPVINNSGSPAVVIGLDQNVTVANANATLPNYYAIRLRTPTISSGAITNAHGIFIAPQKNANITNGYGIYFGSPATDGIGSDISWGGDTRLWRSAAATLRTDAAIVVNGRHSLNSTGTHFMANVSGVPGTPTGGGVVYVENGALKYKGSSGTVTTIAPA